MKTIDMENRLIIVVIVLVACVWQVHGKALDKLDNIDGSQKEAEDSYKDGKVKRATNPLGKIGKRIAKLPAQGDVDKENELGNGQVNRKDGKVRRATKRMNKNGRRIAKRQTLDANDNEKITEGELEDGKERNGIMRRVSDLMFKIVRSLVKRQAKKANDAESTNDRRGIRIAKREGKRKGRK